MVGAMPHSSPKLVRYGAPAALFACGAALLAAGAPAAFGWTLIVVALACAAERAKPAVEPLRRGGAGSREQRAEEHRHLAESRRWLSGPR